MTFRKSLAALLALILALTFAACDKAAAVPSTTAAPTEPPITAEYLYEQIAINAESTPITGANIESEQDITINFASLGTSVTTSMGRTGTMLYSPEQGIRYSELTEGTSAYGQLTTEETVNYWFKEDGANVTYTYNKTTELWTRHVSGQTMSDFCAAALTADSLTLEEAIQTVDDKEVYVLHAQFSGDALKNSIGSVSALLESLDMDPDAAEVDISGVTASVTYYIDTETCLLVQVDSSLEGIGEAITDLVTEYMLESLEEAKDELGSEYASMVQMYKRLTVTVPLDTTSYTNISYEPVTVPELPAEAREAAALQEYDPLQADGSYLLKEVGASAHIIPPEGWTAANAIYYGVEIVSSDENSRMTVLLLSNSTEEDMKGYLDDTVALYKENEVYGSHALNDEVNGWQTATITMDRYSHNYSAWKELKENLWIYVEYIDFTGASMSSSLLPQLEAIAITTN